MENTVVTQRQHIVLNTRNVHNMCDICCLGALMDWVNIG